MVKWIWLTRNGYGNEWVLKIKVDLDFDWMDMG